MAEDISLKYVKSSQADLQDVQTVRHSDMTAE
jgi:hypothetical protein